MATSREVTECRIGSLRSGCVREVRVICEDIGLVYIQRADDLRWNNTAMVAECRIAGTWFTVSALGLVDFAAAEHLPYETAAPPAAHDFSAELDELITERRALEAALARLNRAIRETTQDLRRALDAASVEFTPAARAADDALLSLNRRRLALRRERDAQREALEALDEDADRLRDWNSALNAERAHAG